MKGGIQLKHVKKKEIILQLKNIHAVIFSFITVFLIKTNFRPFSVI